VIGVFLIVVDEAVLSGPCRGVGPCGGFNLTPFFVLILLGLVFVGFSLTYNGPKVPRLDSETKKEQVS